MISILLIGDEILSASVEEGNLYRMLSVLTGIGYEVREVRIVRDVVEEITAAMRELLARSEYLITAGGIGPTHDDRTLEAAAPALGVELERHPRMLAFLKRRYGEPLSPMVARMADLPRGTEVLGCEEDCWPVIRWNNVFILPGLPKALAEKMNRIQEILPPRDRFWSAEVFLRADESLFADWLTERQQALSGALIGSYPVAGRNDYRSRISVRGSSRDLVRAEAEAIAEYARRQGWLVRMGGDLEDE